MITPDDTIPAVLSVQAGRVTPLGPNGVPSGFVKMPVKGPVKVGVQGLEGDAQADLSVHGGLEKAVYAYAAARYADWLDRFPEHQAVLKPGAFGENLTVSGLDENDICAGDVHAIGSVRLQVCQPRQPCFKFALRFNDSRMPNAMMKSGHSGWYYRVLQEGSLTAGDTMRLIDRPNPNLPFSTLIAAVYRGQASPEDLARIAAADGVAQWLTLSAKRTLRESSVAARLRPSRSTAGTARD